MYRDRWAAMTAHNSAMNDVAAIHRALRIVRIFYIAYRGNPTARKYLTELANLLIDVSERAKARHQKASEQI